MISFVATTVVGQKRQFLVFATRDRESNRWTASPEILLESGVYNIPNRIFNHPVEGQTAHGEDVRGFLENGKNSYFIYEKQSGSITFIGKEEVAKFTDL